MKASLLIVLTAATTALAEFYYAETPIEAGLRRRPIEIIVGGEEAAPHSIPFQVGLFLDDNFCGGSLISKRFVLTAAHCGVVTNTPTVVLGAHKIKEKEPEQITMTAKNIINHEHYVQVLLVNDISLIELPQDAPLNQNIQPVKLAPPDSGLFEGVKAQASGWGITYDGSNESSRVLRVVESTIMTNRDCADKFSPKMVIFPTIICLDGSEKKSTCNGDSGGPLFVKQDNETVQIGITSFGNLAGCEKGYPAGFTRITAYTRWIQKNSDYKF